MAVLFLFVISVFWIIIGTLLIFVPDLVKTKFCEKFIAKANLKKLSLLPIIVGVLLILSSSQNNYTVFVTLLGLLGIVKGVMFLVAEEKMTKMMDWWMKSNNTIARIWGVVTITIGAIVLMGI